MAATLYDDVPYPSPPRSATHPARYGVPAFLLGAPGPPVGRARVLEVGCGEAGNLIAMAVGLPEASFHGVDYAPSPIAIGRAEVEALGLANVRLEVADILAFEPEGTYDYIIAHGVYAWTPAAVGDALMALIGRSLSPDGLAFVSYNVAPAGHIRLIVREALLTFLEPGLSELDQLAALPDAAAALFEVWGEEGPLQAAVSAELKTAVARPAEVLFHDELAPHYAPRTITQTATHAAQHGLRYLCDGEGGGLQALLHPKPHQQALLHRAGGDWVRLEQLDDIARLRRFRQSVFVRAERQLAPKDRLEALRALWATGEFKSGGEAEADGRRTFNFRNGGSFSTNHPALITLLDRIIAVHPQAVPLGDFVHDAELADYVSRLYSAMVILLLTAPHALTLTPGERPLASALARRQAARGQAELASLAHTVVKSDPLSRQFLTLLDGTRDRPALVEALRETEAGQGAGLADDIDRALRSAARMGMLLA